jgi:asparagine synthetase B (glutamine-hydrolysing)
VRFFGEADLARLATPALQEQWRKDVEVVHRDAYRTRGHGDPMDGAFRIDLSTYLPDDLLVMADRMSMAHSLELRAPFCDHQFIEESLDLPPKMKIPNFRLKAFLKSAFADVLPREVLSHGKQGFMIPLGRWLRTDLRDMLGDLLAPERVRARGLFNPTVVSDGRRGIEARAPERSPQSQRSPVDSDDRRAVDAAVSGQPRALDSHMRQR